MHFRARLWRLSNSYELDKTFSSKKTFPTERNCWWIRYQLLLKSPLQCLAMLPMSLPHLNWTIWSFLVSTFTLLEMQFRLFCLDGRQFEMSQKLRQFMNKVRIYPQKLPKPTVNFCHATSQFLFKTFKFLFKQYIQEQNSCFEKK